MVVINVDENADGDDSDEDVDGYGDDDEVEEDPFLSESNGSFHIPARNQNPQLRSFERIELPQADRTQRFLDAFRFGSSSWADSAESSGMLSSRLWRAS